MAMASMDGGPAPAVRDLSGPIPHWGLSAPAEPPPPLYGFQDEGVRFLLDRPAALLADEMGLGKSIQAIVACRELIAGGAVQKALVLCPKSLIWDWSRKFRRWAPEVYICPIQGPPRRRESDWRWPRAQVFICGYETWRVDAGLVPHAFDLVILDEAQRIKNPGTLAAQAVHRLQAPRRWALTGTPLENCVEELLAIFYYLQPGLLEGEVLLSTARIREAVRPYTLRRRKEEVLPHLPPKRHREVWLDLTPAQRRRYEAVHGAGLGLLGGVRGQEEMGHLFGLLTRLKEICNLDEETGESAKADFLLAELPAITGRGEKAVVFSQFPHKTLDRICHRFAPFRPAVFSGELSQWQREELVRRFEEEEEPQVLFMSLRVGGVGLTLTRANHVYHFDHWWNPAASSQAEDRVHRIGQHRPVYVTSLLTRGTVEQRIHQVLHYKRELFAQVMEDPSLSRLGREELREIVGMPGPPAAPGDR